MFGDLVNDVIIMVVKLIFDNVVELIVVYVCNFFDVILDFECVLLDMLCLIVWIIEYELLFELIEFM